MACVKWCVYVAVHTHVSCWLLVAIPQHCAVPSGLCCWLHSPLLLYCAAICFVFDAVLLCFIQTFLKILIINYSSCTFHNPDNNFWV